MLLKVSIEVVRELSCEGIVKFCKKFSFLFQPSIDTATRETKKVLHPLHLNGSHSHSRIRLG
jgi:hypothetical protein